MHVVGVQMSPDDGLSQRVTHSVTGSRWRPAALPED